jgi:hypothetical protein
MTLVERILNHRINAAKYPLYSDEWYIQMTKAAEYTREWRQSNTLASVTV